MKELSPELRREICRMVDAKYLPAWLQTPNSALGNRTPQSVLDRGEEAKIWEAIERVKLGDAS